MDRRAGFTFIELLLVVAIIGILGAVAVPQLMGQRESARQKATIATAQSVLAEASGAARVQTGATTATVMAYVANLPNFKHPPCNNAYNPTQNALVAGPAAANGQVGMVATTQLDPDGATINVIAVSYQHSQSGGSVVLGYVPIE